MSERCTEIEGWVAHWRLDRRHDIRILLVRNVSEEEPLLSTSVLAAAPDLVEMRERHPQLSGLWDAIRGEYWAEFPAGLQDSHHRMI